MSPYAAFLLFLAIGLADASSLINDPDMDDATTTLLKTTIAETIATTEAQHPTTTTTTAAAPPPTTTTAAAPPPTTTTAAAPPPTTTTAAAPPPTTTTAAAPPTTTTAATTTKTTTTEAPTTTKTTTTEAPTTTSSAPNTTSSAPNTTSSAPNTTSSAPNTTSSAPNTTSSAPNTTSSAPATTTSPTPTLPSPTAHLYQIKKDNASCLMVKFGLRLGFQGVKYEEMNFEFTNGTNVTGSCGEESSELVILDDTLTIKLTFQNDTKKFSLHALNVTGKTSSGVAFTETNSNLTLWQASLGSSYMCNKEQNYTITKQLTIFTFELQVQPFGVKKDSFSTAQECSMDDTSILIPIVVGAALAGLILIVVIAYVIGRRKTYVGYQTL